MNGKYMERQEMKREGEEVTREKKSTDPKDVENRDEPNIRLAIVGSREFNDYDAFTEKVLHRMVLLGKPSIIISGGAKGTDAMAARFAREHDIPLKEYLPSRDIKSNYRYVERNKKIAHHCTHMIAFLNDNSRGTKMTIAFAEDLNKEIYRIEF